jgi:general secretion pathway protein G
MISNDSLANRGPRRVTLRQSERGMTLIEIMVVLVILSLIATVTSIKLIERLDDARRSTTRLSMHGVETALDVYYSKHGRYPDALTPLVELRLLAKVPKDAWDHEFTYRLEKGKPVLVSFGRDGVSGGEGPDADISNVDPDPDN